MKTIRFYGIILFLTLTSCVKDGDFNLPKLVQKAPNITTTSTIKTIQSALIQEFNRSRRAVYTFPDKKNIWVSGYVVSSDKAGSFYRKLIIQDKPENPTAGIEMLINKSALSETFNFGRKIYILLDGLTVSYDDGSSKNPTNTVGGKFVLGKNNGNIRLDGIVAATYTSHIKRDVEVAKIVPTKIAVKDFNQKNVNTLVELTDMQFEKSALGKTFAAQNTDGYEGLRTLTNSEDTVTLQTSSFASFKSNTIPEKRGSVIAILAKDYKATNYVVIINKPSDLQFSKDRIDAVKSKVNPTKDKIYNIFKEDFETSTNKTPVNFKGWTNFAEKGRRLWLERISRKKGYVEFSCSKTRDAQNVGWLISPPINMDTQKKEVLTFKTAQHHVDSDGNKIEIFVSTDFSGKVADVTKAIWQPITARVAKKTDKMYAFKDSGDIDISSYTGNLYIAFKVTGSGKDKKLDGTFMVDDVVIKGVKK